MLSNTMTILIKTLCFKYPKCSEKCKSLAYFYKKAKNQQNKLLAG